MKKITTFLLTFFLVATLSACGVPSEKKYTPEEASQKAENKESFVMVASNTSCSDCRDFKVEVNKFREQNKEADIIFVEINKIPLYKDRVNFINQFVVQHTPTSYFVNEGKIVHYVEGVLSAEKLADMYTKYVEGTKEK